MKRTPLKRGTSQMKRTPLKKVSSNKVKKRKVRSQRAILRDKAWATFSKWIRNRDKKCVTCGAPDTLQAGHYFHAVLDFDEMNINAQCTRCNKWLHGNLAVYAVYLVNKYGVEELHKLDARHSLAQRGEVRSEQEYLDLIEKYKLVDLST